MLYTILPSGGKYWVEVFAFPCFSGVRATRTQPQNCSIAENKADARGNSLNTVKCTNVISAQTLVPMCDGQDGEAGHADIQGRAERRREKEVLDLDGLNYEGSEKNKTQRSVAGILFLSSRELTPVVTTDD